MIIIEPQMLMKRITKLFVGPSLLLASFQDAGQLEGLESSKGWRKFTGGFFIGSLGGAVVAYLLLNNIAFFS